MNLAGKIGWVMATWLVDHRRFGDWMHTARHSGTRPHPKTDLHALSDVHASTGRTNNSRAQSTSPEVVDPDNESNGNAKQMRRPELEQDQSDDRTKKTRVRKVRRISWS